MVVNPIEETTTKGGKDTVERGSGKASLRDVAPNPLHALTLLMNLLNML